MPHELTGVVLVSQGRRRLRRLLGAVITTEKFLHLSISFSLRTLPASQVHYEVWAVLVSQQRRRLRQQLDTITLQAARRPRRHVCQGDCIYVASDAALVDAVPERVLCTPPDIIFYRILLEVASNTT